MQIGAIVTVPSGIRPESASENLLHPQHVSQAFDEYPFACCEILGQTLLQRTLKSLQSFGIQQPAVLSEESGSESLFPSRLPSAGRFFTAWEDSVRQQVNGGAEILLLIRLGAYLELDFAQLLDFHSQTRGRLTQVYDKKSAFEVAVVNTDQLRGDKGSYRGRLSALIPYHGRYNFTGYSNRLREPQDLRRLACDALFNRNSVRPLGKEIAPGVWIGEGAIVDSTARISAPAYIGAHTRVKGSCVINGATNIERDCEIDFGTSVTDSSVLPETYLGIGLNVVHSMVASNRLFNLDRNVEVEISDRSLVGKQRSVRTLTKLIGEKSFFNRREHQPNGVDSHL